MKKFKSMYLLLVAAIGIIAITAGCSSDSGGGEPAPDVLAVASTAPAANATGVAIDSPVTATFNMEMDEATIIAANFTLVDGVTPVAGVVTYDAPSKTATFTPAADLDYDTVYTATITTAVMDIDANPLAANKVWTFTTAELVIVSPDPVDLGTAANFAILAKSAVTITAVTSDITGDVGVSPAALTLITGITLTNDASNQFATAPEVTGNVYGASLAVPTPGMLTTAVSDMEAAYTDAEGRTLNAVTDIGAAGEIGGLTIVPGLYKFTTAVTIATDVTLDGDGVYIFQIPGALTVTAAQSVLLSGGATAAKIFWQVAGAATIGTTVEFEGTVLCLTGITIGAGSTMNGRALAQTAVTANATLVKP